MAIIVTRNDLAKFLLIFYKSEQRLWVLCHMTMFAWIIQMYCIYRANTVLFEKSLQHAIKLQSILMTQVQFMLSTNAITPTNAFLYAMINEVCYYTSLILCAHIAYSRINAKIPRASWYTFFISKLIMNHQVSQSNDLLLWGFERVSKIGSNFLILGHKTPQRSSQIIGPVC